MLNVARYGSWDELGELRDHWNPLLSQSASDTIFLTWQWLEAWWKNYGDGKRLFVLAARDGEALVGVAPFYVDEIRLYGKKWKRLRLIGDGSHDSDYLDCFAQLGRETEVMGSFVVFLKLQQRMWDWIELNGPLKGSPCVAGIVKYAQANHWATQSEPIRCATLPLPKTWDEYLRQLDSRFRTKVRSALGLLNEQIKSEPERCVTDEQTNNWLPTLFELHTRRWSTQSKPGVFRDAAKRKFYHDFSRSALEQNWLAFHRMNWGERTLAMQYGFVYRDRFHLLQEGYDPDFSTIRPGVALRAWLMRHWIESGLEEYDFLAGVSDYKRDWGGQEKTATRVLILPKRLSEMIALNGPRLAIKAREKAGQLVPKPLMALRKRMVSKRAQGAWQARGATPVEGPKRAAAAKVRQLAAAAYSSTFLGRIGHSLATSYCWSREKDGGVFPFQSRTKPVCHIFHYHRVNDDADPFLGGLSVDAFRAQMQHLARNFPIVTLDQVARGEFPPQHPYSVAITFDDGYRDNFVCAFPILKSMGIPATVFLATGYVESGELPWYDQVRLAFKLTKCSRFSMASAGGPSADLTDVTSRARLSEVTLRWFRSLQEVDRKAAALELFRELRVPCELNLPNQMLRWEDIRQMTKYGVIFGAHTITHPVLSRISLQQLQKEIAGSKRVIENRLQTAVVHFAYPFGQVQDFGLEAKHAVQEAGFKTAVTTVWGVNEPDSDLLELRRFAPWQSDPAEFKLKLDWYRFRELQPAPKSKMQPADLPLSARTQLS